MLKKYECVCYELLRPSQIKAIREKAPIAYIVAGALEWHGHQNPLGCDSLKAHAVCCEAALRFGGVVLPPLHIGHMIKDSVPDKNWGPQGWEGYTLGYNRIETLEAAVAGHARALAAAGWKVIAGVTGHDIDAQRDAMERAILAAVKGGPARGFAVKEGELHHPTEEIPLQMDHAGAWETSCMLYACPETVDLAELTSRGLAKDDHIRNIDGPEGIAGLSPLKHASPELGKRIIEGMGALIGAKAAGMLHSNGSVL
jgi:creatinine amidohydrolase